MAAIESVVPITLPADPAGLTEAARQTYVDYLGIPKFVDAAERDAYFANPLTPLRAGQFCYLSSLDEFLRYDGTFMEWGAPAGGGIPIFADEAARDAEIIAPIEGQYCHLLNLDQLQVYDGTAWTNAVPPDVFVEGVEPTAILTDVIWADTSQVVAMDTLPFLPITGGVMTGEITFNNDNQGLTWTAGGGRVYKKSGGGMYLRKNSTNLQWKIENNDGTGAADIITAAGGTFLSGATLNFPNVADVPKINLYADTFGLGITSGSTVIFASSTIRFKQNSITGTEWMNITANGIGPSVSHNVSYENGFSGTCDFRVTPAVVTCRITGLTRSANTDVNVQTKVCNYPAGVPAPPNVSTGYRALAHERNANFTMDGAARFVTLHFDGTGLWIIATGDIFYSGKYIDAVVTWAR